MARLTENMRQRALTLPPSTAALAASDTEAAIQKWADLEAAADVLATAIATEIVDPESSSADRISGHRRASEIASAVGLQASASAAEAALERAIVCQAVASAAEALAAGVAADAREVVSVVAQSADRVRAKTQRAARAVTASAVPEVAESQEDGPSAGMAQTACRG